MAKVLITAGPTREYLDDVRYLANASSGRMGYAIAAAAAAGGHQVVLVSGPTSLATPPGVERIDVVSAREMHDRAVAAFADCDVAFGVAAVADFRPAVIKRGKPAKEELAAALELVANPDVVAALARIKGARRVVVGFALESFAPDAPESALARAREKLRRKALDLCVLNPTETMGAESATAFLLDAEGGVEALGPAPKAVLAERLVARAIELVERRRTDREATR